MSDAAWPPHSHPFRMIDVVLEIEHGHAATIKSATTGEVVRDEAGASQGRYPFSLLLEAMAQAAVPLADAEGGEHAHDEAPAKRPAGALAGIDGAHLLRPVGPGDRLLISASIVGRFGRLIRVKSVAELAGSAPGEVVVAEGEFTISLEEGA